MFGDKRSDGTCRLPRYADIPADLKGSMELFGNTSRDGLGSHVHSFVGYRRAGEIVAAGVFSMVFDREVAVPIGLAFRPRLDRVSILPELLRQGFEDERGFAPGLTYVAFRVTSYAEWEALARTVNEPLFPGPESEDQFGAAELLAQIFKRYGLTDASPPKEELPLLTRQTAARCRDAFLTAWWKARLAGGCDTLVGLARYRRR